MKQIQGFIFLLISFVITSTAQQVIPLYSGGAIPGNKSVPDKEVIASDGFYSISHISRPTLRFTYLPKKGEWNCGSYLPGRRLFGRGIQARRRGSGKEVKRSRHHCFIVKYRIPDDAVMENKTIAPLQDAQRAIKIVRDSATKFGIDPKRVGILGFSAGGHLASTAGTHFSKAWSKTRNKPAFAPTLWCLSTRSSALTIA
jgi:hypothetical protein